jgi:phage tail sheath protein FI
MSSKSNHLGVAIEEIPSGATAIQGVATSSTAFIGASAGGVLNQPVQVQSLNEFESAFGGLPPDGKLGAAVGQFFLNGGTDAWIVRVPHAAKKADWLDAMATLDSALFNLLVLPGVAAPAIVAHAVEYCEKRRAFLILDSPAEAKTPAQMQQLVQSGALPRSANAAVYFPWIQIAGGNALTVLPPSGAVAGVYSRLDAARGVWKAPAGLDASLAGVQALETVVTDAENEILNSLGVNCLRSFPADGPVVWGARTLAGADDLASQWKYIPVRRLALFLEESIFQGTKWAAFEPNGEPLWAQLRLNIGAFMQNLFRQGAFQGQTSPAAYFVKCDAETTTQNDINQGLVNIVIGFAPLHPAEFIIISLQQMAGLSS